MGGIGTSICQRLHKDGLIVIAGCGPSRDHVKWLAEQTALGYTNFHASVGNVADWDSTTEAFKRARAQFGPVLVDNTSVTHDGMFRKMSKADWDAVMDTNLNSLFNMTERVIDDVVDVVGAASSTSARSMAKKATPTNYSAAKAGMHGFTMALARSGQQGCDSQHRVAGLHRH